MISLRTVTLPTPQMPPRGMRGRVTALVTAAVLHTAAAAVILAVSAHVHAAASSATAADARTATPIDVTRIVFLPPARPEAAQSGGGGGGGNRQAGPIRHASGIGNDAITLRTRKPSSLIATTTIPVETLPAVVLDAKPLASGTFDQIGLPVGGVSFGTSTGPGSGGGVGEGEGTGIGPGRGPGVGPGEGGGIGGGVYRPGGNVTAPRLLSQVQPVYTSDALMRHIEGRVVLEVVVRRDGCASDIRVVRHLDPGLDEQAMLAVSQWKFDPGRLAGSPVDVVANIVLDFTIR